MTLLNTGSAAVVPAGKGQPVRDLNLGLRLLALGFFHTASKGA